MQYFRSGKLNLKAIDLVLALLLPFLVIISFILIGKLSFNPSLILSDIISIVLWEIFGTLMAGILEELLFRGYIMKLVEVKWNQSIAIIAIIGYALICLITLFLTLKGTKKSLKNTESLK